MLAAGLPPFGRMWENFPQAQNNRRRGRQDYRM